MRPAQASRSGRLQSSRRWASRWVKLGDASHINAEAGFGPLPLARRWVMAARQRLARDGRPMHASVVEWSFAA